MPQLAPALPNAPDAPDASRSSARRRYHVYVIELAESVWSENAFRWRNHQRNPRRPCLYVGQTALTPEARFEQHRAGHKANRYAERYGLELRQDLARRALGGREPRYASRTAALRAEEEAARELRAAGCAVWSA